MVYSSFSHLNMSLGCLGILLESAFLTNLRLSQQPYQWADHLGKCAGENVHVGLRREARTRLEGVRVTQEHEEGEKVLKTVLGLPAWRSLASTGCGMRQLSPMVLSDEQRVKAVIPGVYRLLLEVASS